MKRLILFKGGVETLEFFTEQMAAVWEKMGYSVFWYNLMLQQASSSALVEFLMLTAQTNGICLHLTLKE